MNDVSTIAMWIVLTFVICFVCGYCVSYLWFEILQPRRPFGWMTQENFRKAYWNLMGLTYSEYEPLQMGGVAVVTVPRLMFYDRDTRLMIYLQPDALVHVCDPQGKFQNVASLGEWRFRRFLRILRNSHRIPNSNQGLVNDGRPVA